MYWAIFGWALALGVVVAIYIHEMGQVAMIRRYGLPASAPMFIPGVGAFIQLGGVSLPPIPDSRVGLAGPMYGVGAALAALGVYYVTDVKIWGVIAHFTAWVNLFNLIPVWQLDGSRGLKSFTRLQCGLVLMTAVILWLLCGNPMLALIARLCVSHVHTRLADRARQSRPVAIPISVGRADGHPGPVNSKRGRRGQVAIAPHNS